MDKFFRFFITLFLSLFVAFFSYGEERKKVSLTVDQAVLYAKEHSRAIKSAAIDVESESDNRNHVLNVLCPNVSFSGSLSRPNTEPRTYSASGSASISINWGLSIIEDIKKAKRDYEAGVITWNQTVRQNERDVKKLFYSILLQQESLKNDRETLENTYKRYENTKKSFESGASPKLNVLQSRVTYQNMKLDFEKSEQAFKQQLRQFASVLGISADTEIELIGNLDTELLDIDRKSLLARYSAYNSEIRLLETQLQGINAQIRGADLKSYTPNFSFNYSTKPTLASIDNDWFESSNWQDRGNMSFSLTWNLTDALPFSNNRIKRRDMERQRAQTMLKIEQKREDIILDTEKLFDQLASSKEAVIASRENITLAEESYRLLSSAYNNGSADYIEIKEAETQLNKARLAQQSELCTYICTLTDLEYMLDLPKDWQNR
ncbi:MAG: TolC family protein [Treponema sp.]|nr:TolC family protein [Treponema sp.]